MFVPGEVIFFSCRLDGYQVSPVKKISDSVRVLRSRSGRTSDHRTCEGKVQAELALEDKEWKPKVRQSVLVPPLAESGSYKMRFSAKDELGGGCRRPKLRSRSAATLLSLARRW